MDPRIHSIHQPISIPTAHKRELQAGKSTLFHDVFQQEANRITISKHARARLQERNIEIQPKTWAEITEKVEEAKKKGVTDSVVLTKDTALVVSTKNNTVITAMNREEAASQIFTNINGTIIMKE
ncbi:TIGR02530 family flagellar biosynthesis protein [Pontibacillus salicampi]|uniref:TIGR02530 family flagellar biosynthesis protein n=1 Tax=Pontibacillus salicampi TaxID=1449801 RepID=A0ABV6LPG9_9BACI